MSLLSAADRLRVKSAFDGQLFAARHLLILREITRNLDLAQKDETGGSNAGGAADLYGVAGEFNSQTLVSSTHISRPASQILYLPSCRVHRRSSPVRCSPLSVERGQNTSRMRNECVLCSF